MKIKRWAVYDGIIGDYFPERFLFRRGAEKAIVRYIIALNYVVVALTGENLKQREIDSVRVVELA